MLLFLLLSFTAWSQDDDYYIEEEEETEEQTEAQETKEEVAPQEEESSWRDKVFFGGGGGLQFSNIGTYITVMPSVGYRITPKLHAGIMGTYQFIRYRQIKVSANNYGASLFARYFVLQQVYLTTEYEQINYQYIYADGSKRRQWVDRMLVGAGYFQPNPRGRGGFHIGILYDLYYTSRADYPYQSPLVYRVGIIF